MKLECFRTLANTPRLVPGQPERDWMERVAGRTPYRCLPMTMANTTGWDILCPFGFTAEWNGGDLATDIQIKTDIEQSEQFVLSHFAFGILTFYAGYLFRTPPGWGILAQGSPNHIKHGIQALSGLVETDWLPFPFTMNWLFTEPGRIRFEKDEPFCFITLMEHGKLEEVQPVLLSLDSDPGLKSQYFAWSASRNTFNQRLYARDPQTMQQSWQKHYFKGEPPPDGGASPDVHVSKRRLKHPISEK